MTQQELVQLVTNMGLFGIPSIFAMTAWCIRKCNQYTRQLIVLMQAQKAQMRAQLLKDYAHYREQGWISDIEMQEWQNQYNSYHQLVGENGVLDDRYEKLMNLPNIPPE